jgi:CubicO group peptidase (beta-lactamase class C family)
MKRISKYLILCTTILTLLLPSCAWFGQSRLVVNPEAVTRVDEILTGMTSSGNFTGSVLIAQNGKVLLSKGYGFADRSKEIPNTPVTRFHLVSISKQFTAMAILILESQAKLTVKDPICDYIADCPAAWRNITIPHLLTHSSGLSSRLDGIVDTAASDLVTPSDPAHFIALTGGLPLYSRPGEQYAYSNFGYDLLAHIIEQVSGQSHAAFLKQAIFTPLNMHSTDLVSQMISLLAFGYPLQAIVAAIT